MDELDIKIIKLLQFNARMTISEVGNKINLSVPAVSERMRKLETSGVIEKYAAILNPGSFRKKLTALIFISLKKPEFYGKLVEFVRCEDEILECYYLAWNFDYVLKIITEDTTTLERLQNRIKNVEGVIETQTIVTLSAVKNNHFIVPITDYFVESKVIKNEKDWRSADQRYAY
jgi:Transcriptional regulators